MSIRKCALSTVLPSLLLACNTDAIIYESDPDGESQNQDIGKADTAELDTASSVDSAVEDEPDSGTDDSGRWDDIEPKDEGLSFTRELLVEQPGSAFLRPVDLDSDGYEEFLLTCLSEGIGWDIPPLGPGGAYVLSRNGGVANGSIGTWSTREYFNYWDFIDYPNVSTLFDVDNDGIDDWVIGTGFLMKPTGRIIWMKGSMNSGELDFGLPTDIAVPDTSRWYHEAMPIDMDGDGDIDFVTTNNNGTLEGWGDSKLEWFENLGVAGEAQFAVHPIADVGGALLTIHDLDGDGDQDIILPQYGGNPALLWVEQTPSGWTTHDINSSAGRGFNAQMADMNGDGQLDLVFGNHNHQSADRVEDRVMGVYWWEVPNGSDIGNLENWDDYMHVIHEGFYVDESDPNANGAPGVVRTGDIDGDGDIDVTASGDGDDGIYLFLNDGTGLFEMMTLDTGMVMAGDHYMTDLDGDGDQDIIWAVFGEIGLIGPESAVYAYLQDN